MKYPKLNKTFKNESDEDDIIVSGQQYLEYVERSMSLNQVSVYIDEPVKHPAYYRRVADRISSLGEHDEVRLVINSPGGRLDGLVTLLDAMLQSGAKSTAVISGECHSAASILALNCDEIQVSPYAGMLVHFVSFHSGGKGSDVRDQVNHTLDYSEVLFRDTYSGFLSEEEMLQVIAGKEMWLNAQEIADRLQARSAFLMQAESEAQVEEYTEPEVLEEIKPEAKASKSKSKAKP